METGRIRSIKVDASRPEEHLAWDEWLLDESNAGRLGPCIRTWRLEAPVIVLGYGNRPEQELDLGTCERFKIPVLRRSSGGGAVLLDSGCLNYSLILPISFADQLATPGGCNGFIMSKQRRLMQSLLQGEVSIQGDTDLVWKNGKISGNAQRRRRHSILFHGSMLCSVDIALMEKVLNMPSRQPLYRNQRSHACFVRNIQINPESLESAMHAFWGAEEDLVKFTSDQLGAETERFHVTFGAT